MQFASTLLPKLAKLLQDEYNLHKGARKGIEFLYMELETIHAALRKIGEVPREQLDGLQRIWAHDVRELSYDMEDIVDTFMVDIKGPEPPSKRGAKKIFKKMIRKVAKAMARREVAQEINDIRERVRELAERRDRYKLDAIAPANKTPVDPRLKALYTKVTELVGIGEAKEEVIARLIEGDGGQQKNIVSIAGFGGLGKTTLAKAVYDEIKGQFDCTAFVSVSRNPDAQKLLKDILYELHKGGHPGANLDEIKHLIDLVRDFLWNQRPLLRPSPRLPPPPAASCASAGELRRRERGPRGEPCLRGCAARLLGRAPRLRRGEVSKGGQGTACAYAVVDFDGQRHRTATRLRDLNPQWGERLEFLVHDPDAMASAGVRGEGRQCGCGG